MKMNFKKIFMVCLGLMFSIIMFAGCGSSNSQNKENASESSSVTTENLLKSIKAKGVLVVGTASGYPPYEFIDTSNAAHKVTGIDMALAQALADKLSVKLKIEDMSFTALLSSLGTGKVDLAIAGINITDERKKNVDFSNVYLQAQQKILVRKEDKATLNTLDDFKGKTIGAEKSTTQEKLAQTEMASSKLVSLDKVPDLMLELMNKKIDGIIVENIVAEQYLLSNDQIVFSDAAFQKKDKDSAIAINKGNEDLLKIINETIKENQDNGNFDKWVKDYSSLAVNNAK